VQNNNLTGSIPVELGNLANLVNLHLENNNFSSSIPEELGKLTNLRILSLADNDLSGSIPAQFGNLISLREMNLANNDLTGFIPTELTNLVYLTSLELSFNRLYGCFPVMLEEFWETIGFQQGYETLTLCPTKVTLSTAVLELEEGAEATYTVVLRSNPLRSLAVDITGMKNREPVNITNVGHGEIRVDTTSFLFTEHNWNVPQVVTVHARVDDDLEDEEVKLNHRVRGNYPNPFHLSTRIVFELPQREVVSLEISDLLGRTVQTFTARNMEAGMHKTITMDMPDLVSGTYLYRLIAVYGGKQHVQYGRMMLIK